MSDRMRQVLIAGVAAVVALSLVFGAAAASEVDDGMEPMASMEPMEPMASMEPGLVVRDAWTRESMMMELAGAAYMVIHNGTDVDDALVAASSPAAAVVEIHQTAMDEDGMMAMSQVEAIPIPAHGDAILEPGGYHIMLIDLVEPLAEGAMIEVSLEFEAASPQTVMVPVMATGPMGMEMGDMDHGMDDDSEGMAPADEDDPEADG